MAGRKKLPEGQLKGEIIQFRYTTKKAEELDALVTKFAFKDRTKLIRWSVDLAKQILEGDTRFIETIFNQFPRPEDPRQLDIFEQMQVTAKAEVYSRMAEAMREVPETLQAVADQHLK